MGDHKKFQPTSCNINCKYCKEPMGEESELNQMVKVCKYCEDRLFSPSYAARRNKKSTYNLG